MSDELTPEELARLLGGAPFDEVAGGHLAGPGGGLDELDADFADDLAEEAALLSEREQAQRRLFADTDWEAEAQQVADELLARVGEEKPQPRLAPTRRTCELLGDVHRAWPMVHITGTNGKTSTARITEALLRAHGLRTGLLTSPHLVRLSERIAIDGEPIADERLVANWRDIQPFLAIVDAELAAAGEPALTYFEALTVLAFACFADAPVDVAVVEVGMGGEWDSTNVADADVAVFTPIALDHTRRLGSTVAEIARTKAGIIKPGSLVVTAAQPPDALAEIRAAAARVGARVYGEPDDFAVTADALAVGGRLISVRGITGEEYRELALPLAGDYQAHNAALTIAAVEAFFGGERPLRAETVEVGIAAARSPGRLEVVAHAPTVVVDAAHNPHGAAHLALAFAETFAFDDVTLILGILADKNAAGIVRALAPLAARILVTAPDSPRALPADALADTVAETLGEASPPVTVFARPADALAHAREAAGERGGVLVTGSILLIGEVVALICEEEA